MYVLVYCSEIPFLYDFVYYIWRDIAFFYTGFFFEFHCKLWATI